MPTLVPIAYHGKHYPEGVQCEIAEASASFDRPAFHSKTPYILHTEHSFASRPMETEVMRGMDFIKQAQRRGVPQLWFSEEWSRQFAHFLFRLAGDSVPPSFIEVSPPFNDYCPDLAGYIRMLDVFDEELNTCWKNVPILTENRCGTYYTGGRFLVTKARDLLALCGELAGRENYGIVLDYPQLISIEYHDMEHFKIAHFEEINLALRPYRHLIRGFHLWGKMKNRRNQWTSHCGNFDTMFSGNTELKFRFLRSIRDLCDDGLPRYVVPEVNSHIEDLHAIVRDLLQAGFTFQNNF